MSSDRAVSASGGAMERLTGSPCDVVLTAERLGSLEVVRGEVAPGAVPAGEAPRLTPGAQILWSYGGVADAMRVVSDDERGLVAWLPSGSQRIVRVPRDGRGFRDRTPEERLRLIAAGALEATTATWTGPGVLRVAPAGRPWSVWFFGDDEDGFRGHYVNLELPHLRVPGATLSQDLFLDLWFDADESLWLKDADELAAAVAVGLYDADQAAVVTDLAHLAWGELVLRRAWPLDAGYEVWRPEPGGDEPLVLPPAVG